MCFSFIILDLRRGQETSGTQEEGNENTGRNILPQGNVIYENAHGVRERLLNRKQARNLLGQGYQYSIIIRPPLPCPIEFFLKALKRFTSLTADAISVIGMFLDWKVSPGSRVTTISRTDFAIPVGAPEIRNLITFIENNYNGDPYRVRVVQLLTQAEEDMQEANVSFFQSY